MQTPHRPHPFSPRWQQPPLGRLAAAAAAALLLGTPPARAQQADPTQAFVRRASEATGLEFWGYARAGFYDGHRQRGRLRGNYTLGGDLQKYRLGNEGDNFVEFGIGKRIEVGAGREWGVFYMPKNYNGSSGTAQLYTSLRGLFGNGATVWAGQRYHRIQDVHIVDHWVMEDGDHHGVGIDDLPLGSRLGTMNIALYTADAIDDHAPNPNRARRLNLQWRNIPANAGGTLTLTGALVSGRFARGSDGGSLGLLHHQKNFLVAGLDNSFFLQASNGHASISGKFHGLDGGDGAQPGARQRRVLDVINFQFQRWGGQAMAGYQTLEAAGEPAVKDFSLGGRVAYALAPYTKLLAEIGITQRKVRGERARRLDKGTIAVAFAPATTFWARPELRFYATHARWNRAAADAHAEGFGLDGRRRGSTVGAQVEAWW
ncbi:carbohydrate porin [Aquincola sp. MAHUQ-54]|uniref:Carbohydrate porin n=1 Tax=Aquincola agrisoli TaxID=3119538 RepID=A0AAW9QMX5_9BURK